MGLPNNYSDPDKSIKLELASYKLATTTTTTPLSFYMPLHHWVAIAMLA